MTSLRTELSREERSFNAGIQAAWERTMMMVNTLPAEPVTYGAKVMRDAALDIADSILELKVTLPRTMDEATMTFIAATCPCCNGSGVEAFRVTVYEPGCGFAHDDTDERPCRECNGDGVIETEVDPIA